MNPRPFYVVVDKNKMDKNGDALPGQEPVLKMSLTRLGCRLWLEEFGPSLRRCVPCPVLRVRRGSFKVHAK